MLALLEVTAPYSCSCQPVPVKWRLFACSFRTFCAESTFAEVKVIAYKIFACAIWCLES